MFIFRERKKTILSFAIAVSFICFVVLAFYYWENKSQSEPESIKEEDVKDMLKEASPSEREEIVDEKNKELERGLDKMKPSGETALSEEEERGIKEALQRMAP